MTRYTTTVDVWTSFSKANVSVLVGVPTARGKLTTMTPVYALGSPIQSTSLVTYPDIYVTFTTVTGNTPRCKFTGVTTAPTETNCGQCTMNGGTVELLYWTDQATIQAVNAESKSLRSAVLNGTTLYSPSVYISFQTAFATNSCGRVGRNHTGTILAMRPQDLSTQVHWGGKVLQSGANDYATINYADLYGLPPVDVYESQPSCIMFGCATIYTTSYFPTIVIPPQMRSLDSAWQDCAVGLEGLYDPPLALTPQAVMATPTIPSVISPMITSASPQSTRVTQASPTTALSTPSSSSFESQTAPDPADSKSLTREPSGQLSKLKSSEGAIISVTTASLETPESMTSDAFVESETTIASDAPEDPETTDSLFKSESGSLDPTSTSTSYHKSESVRTSIDTLQQTTLGDPRYPSSVESLNALSIMLSALDDPTMQISTTPSVGSTNTMPDTYPSLAPSRASPVSGAPLQIWSTAVSSEAPQSSSNVQQDKSATAQGMASPTESLIAGSDITIASSETMSATASHDPSRAGNPFTARLPALTTAAMTSLSASEKLSAIATVASSTTPASGSSRTFTAAAAHALPVLLGLLILVALGI
ncbi:hypothetical protein LTR56_022727 [Elasticomyces elasticus]|nr:hypothetical protein LTR22_025428 [Elasticomyces elasticus]KAK3621552.1 hypothetical protein LTR56_022727 [Elasticomyces elasticus]KAK4908047.1 hypothetical protein LTR49_023002 [Elasticomyces elasticus]KAK5740469.1 hypothetical protein LTS12_024929 [Elasticomyces elasticus]